MLAVLIYAAAVAIPVYLLHRFRSQAWYWHLLAIAAAVALGVFPMPPALQTSGFDLTIGFLFVALIFWGIGGLVVFLPHHEKHA